MLLRRIVSSISLSFKSESLSLLQRRALSTLVKEISKFDRQVGVRAGQTPPGTWYVRDDIFELEKSSVFSKNWIAVPGAHHLIQPGDYVTGFLGDEPYLIVKDKENNTQYFYNLCRHHGTLLCDEHKGNAKEFTCPYHAWQYGLDGRLTKAKRLRSIENFSAKNYGLKSFSGTSWFGILFLNQSTAAKPDEFQNKLSSLTKELNRLDCYENNLSYISTMVFTLNCNWKVVIDNYLDGGYHVPICHQDLNSVLDEKSYKIESYDGYSIQSTSGSDPTSRVGSSAIYCHIYPNLFINRYGKWLDVNYVIPTGPQTCDVVMDYFYDKDAFESMRKGDRALMVQKALQDSKQVQEEDNVICERVQKGMRSKSFESGRYAPMVEHLMYDFHCQVANDYLYQLENKF